ncbi:hypothetical protein ACL9RL_02470 [Plantibacter sp. Mn2098]|uniref:hypothetical protein n=1 Tax=Plantibacter sp. Mn2098 TaxID=3395266 RepID=UPI003BEB034B
MPAAARSRLRSLLSHGSLYAVVCWLAAAWWLARGEAAEFVPFLLALLAGVLCGTDFVDALQRFDRLRTRLLVHAGVVIAVAAALAWSTASVGLATLFRLEPPLLSGTFFFLFIAALPFTAWSGLALFTHITWELIDRRPMIESATPEWNGERGVYTLKIRAVPMSTTTGLVILTAGCLLGGGAYLSAVVALQHIGFGIGTGVLVLLSPIFLVVVAATQWLVRRRAVEHTVRLTTSIIDLAAGTNTMVAPLTAVRSVRLRPRGLLARIEYETADGRRTLLVGMGHPSNWMRRDERPLIPRFPKRIVDLLEHSGLSADESAAPKELRFIRER